MRRRLLADLDEYRPWGHRIENDEKELMNDWNNGTRLAAGISATLRFSLPWFLLMIFLFRVLAVFIYFSLAPIRVLDDGGQSSVTWMLYYRFQGMNWSCKSQQLQSMSALWNQSYMEMVHKRTEYHELCWIIREGFGSNLVPKHRAIQTRVFCYLLCCPTRCYTSPLRPCVSSSSHELESRSSVLLHSNVGLVLVTYDRISKYHTITFFSSWLTDPWGIRNAHCGHISHTISVFLSVKNLKCRKIFSGNFLLSRMPRCFDVK